ncbi:MucR family transcriptional regulator [Methylobacterium longum]|uniref:MucR family transcriptional regulator n=1 Tax=Methylobacterium longum TaxID=767694 RepID=A0ABT8AYT1_9HYPH|nr:MucR family transcriptional regulator [Methylobacterium longum]MDN3575147.1 MucR family transcriptional regulator [Methylobacterium longum]GJE15152.1 Transcriptional regulatory protein ros [Methylobacterium longum]
MNEDAETSEAAAVDYVQFAADIVSAYVSNNPVRPADIAELLRSVHASIARLGQGAAAEARVVEKLTAAQIRKSVTPDALISFLDGKPYKTLKRHLSGNGMTIEEYRERFGLPRDYPSTAASYSAQRSELAKSLGLGQLRRKAAPKAATPAETMSNKPKRAGRSRKVKEPAEA